MALVIVTDAAMRDKIADLYRAAYLEKVGGQLIAGFLPSGTPEAKLMSSTEWLVENMAKVPALVIPCYEPTCREQKGTNPSIWQPFTGQSFPPSGIFNWRCMLVDMERASRLFTCTARMKCANCSEFQKLHVQGCLLPVGRLRAGG